MKNVNEIFSFRRFGNLLKHDFQNNKLHRHHSCGDVGHSACTLDGLA